MMSAPAWIDPAPALPHTLYSHSCTVNSFRNPSFRITGFQYETWMMWRSDNGMDYPYEQWRVDVYNGATAQLFPLDGSGWAESADNSSLPGSLQVQDCWWSDMREVDRSGCHVGYQKETRQLSLHLEWVCDDRDPYHPLVVPQYPRALVVGQR